MSLKKGRPSSYRGGKINYWFARKALAGQCHYCAWFQQGDDSVVLTLMLLLVSLAHLTSLLWAAFATAPILHRSPARLKPPQPSSFKVSIGTVRPGGSCVEIPLLHAQSQGRLPAQWSLCSLQQREAGRGRQGGFVLQSTAAWSGNFSSGDQLWKKNNERSSCFLLTRGQGRQRVGVSPSQMKLARISKNSSVHE